MVYFLPFEAHGYIAMLSDLHGTKFQPQFYCLNKLIFSNSLKRNRQITHKHVCDMHTYITIIYMHRHKTLGFDVTNSCWVMMRVSLILLMKSQP